MVSESPLVSVVIPTYNRASLCKLAVQSALAQSYRPLEIIVVDDGSTDETPTLFANAGDPVRYIRQENSERAAARNRGIAASRGTYVAFLDSDDFWAPDHLDCSVKMLESHPEAALAFGEAVYTTEAGLPVRKAPGPKAHRGLLDSSEAIEAISRNFVPFPLSSVVARKDVVVDLRFNEDRSLARSEDWELWARVAARYPVVATGCKTTFLRMHEGNSSQDAERTATAMRRALELAFSDPIASQKLAPFRHYLEASMDLEVGRLWALAGRKDEARRCLRSLKATDVDSIDRSALRRLEVMVLLPTQMVRAVRYLARLVDMVKRYPERDGLSGDRKAASL